MMNLIICFTPLQVVIAKRIIELHPNERFYGILCYKTTNEKYEYYFKILQAHCEKTDYVEIPKNKYCYLKLFYKIKKKLHHYTFDKFFISNIDSILISFIEGNIKYNSILTFDDGTANIISGGINFFKRKRIIKKIIGFFVGIKYSPEYFAQKTQKHYTIYPGQANITHRLESISLFKDIENIDNQKITCKKKIYLGQPVFEEDTSANIRLIKKIHSQIGIEAYYIHPRESYKVEGIEYIHSHLIFEQYLIEELKKNPHVFFEVYTITSGAVINMINFPRTKVISIKMEEELPNITPVYKIFEQLGIEIIPLK